WLTDGCDGHRSRNRRSHSDIQPDRCRKYPPRGVLQHVKTPHSRGGAMNAVITNGIRASLLLAASALLALTSCDVAAVICSPLPVYVGPAADSSCKYHTIKEAIDATNASTCP